MSRFTKAVLVTGLFVGSADLFAAYMSSWIKTGKFADKMLFYIAGGGLGLETSMKGGNGVAFLGLFFHYFIAMSFTLFFFWIFPKVKFLSFNKYLVGVLYGIFANLVVWTIIQYISPLPSSPFVLSNALVAWFILAIFLGIPIVYNTYRFYGVKGEQLWAS
jgi:hypothetical protein